MRVEFAERPAVGWRMLLSEGDGPMSERTLRVAPQMLARLTMTHPLPPRIAGLRLHEEAADHVDELVLTADRQAVMRRWALAPALRERAPSMVLAGAPGSGRATAICAAAREGGRTVVETVLSADRHAAMMDAARNPPQEAPQAFAQLVLDVNGHASS